MDQEGIEKILETLKAYSEAAEEAVCNLQKYNYKDEALNWENSRQQIDIEISHPTLHNLYSRLIRFTSNVIYRDDNLERDRQLSRDNITAVTDYLNVSQDRQLGARFNRIRIEPMKEVTDEFLNLNLLTEARRLLNIYNFAYGIRQWYVTTKYNPGTPIQINTEISYDEATPQELEADRGYKTFASLFKPSCNYTTSQKRALYNELKNLYTTIDPKDADRTVMAVILTFRQPKNCYRGPFCVDNITRCKEKAMASFGRDTSTIRSYTENSLTGNPQLGLKHVKRAESIIEKALAFTR